MGKIIKMPEGPEVRCITDQLQHLVSCTIGHYTIIQAKSIITQCDIVLPTIISNVYSYGKKIIIQTDQFNMIISLGMTGRILSEDFTSYDCPKHSKIVLLCKKDEKYYKIIYEDMRGFGNVTFCKDFSPLQKLGIDVLQYSLDNKITLDLLYCTLSKYPTRKIVDLLLEQSVLCGIGNYLRSEILRAACIHPLTPICKISEWQWQYLTYFLPKIMIAAYTSGGLTIQDYISPNGQRGNYQCMVYHKDFDHEGYQIDKLIVAGRSVFYTPAIQILAC